MTDYDSDEYKSGAMEPERGKDKDYTHLPPLWHRCAFNARWAAVEIERLRALVLSRWQAEGCVGKGSETES